jgi:hypothetical protein
MVDGGSPAKAIYANTGFSSYTIAFEFSDDTVDILTGSFIEGYYTEVRLDSMTSLYQVPAVSAESKLKQY